MGAKLGMIAMTAACLLACAPEGPAAIVVGSMIPDDECVVSADSTFLLKGSYDVSAGVRDQCNSSYNMALLVNSYLIRRGSPTGSPPTLRAEPNVLRITEASVELLQVNGVRFPFNMTTPALPNPFSVTTFAMVPPSELEDPGAGIALVEVIPSFYAPQLMQLAGRGGTVVAAITLFGETTGGVEVELAEYRIPIQLCNGCLTVCREDLDLTQLEDLVEGTCNDNASADGRYCIQNCATP